MVLARTSSAGSCRRPLPTVGGAARRKSWAPAGDHVTARPSSPGSRRRPLPMVAGAAKRKAEELGARWRARDLKPAARIGRTLPGHAPRALPPPLPEAELRVAW